MLEPSGFAGPFFRCIVWLSVRGDVSSISLSLGTSQGVDFRPGSVSAVAVVVVRGALEGGAVEGLMSSVVGEVVVGDRSVFGRGVPFAASAAEAGFGGIPLCGCGEGAGR